MLEITNELLHLVYIEVAKDHVASIACRSATSVHPSPR